MIHLDVAGTPVTQGSLSAFVTKSGRAVVTNKTKKGLQPYRDSIHWHARSAMGRKKVKQYEGPVAVEATFVIQRPMRPSNPFPPEDVDKYARALLDALSGTIYRDDKQVVTLRVTKEYGDVAKTLVTVREVPVPDENSEAFAK